jgi:GNAT superfamily N-acetyltransferase
LHLALWDPPPAVPETQIYAEDWGRPTDLGLVAVVEGIDVGACWMRVLPQGVGLAFVDAMTPQLRIALEPGQRRKGYGKALLLRTLREAGERGYSQVSLTVHPLHPAIALYEACGFSTIGERDSYHLMLAKVSG